MTENDIKNMTYGEILDLCEKYKPKWCKEINRKYCIILQADRCPRLFSLKEENSCSCEKSSKSSRFEENNFIGEIKEGEWRWVQEIELFVWKCNGDIYTSHDNINWTKRTTLNIEKHKDMSSPVITPEEIREALKKGVYNYIANTHEWNHDQFNKVVEIMERIEKEIQENLDKDLFVPYILTTTYIVEREPEPLLTFDVRYKLPPIPKSIEFTIDVKGLDEE